jgi:hypothetical protein
LGKHCVNTASLSPFGKEVGFAMKGEINYKGESVMQHPYIMMANVRR